MRHTPKQTKTKPQTRRVRQAGAAVAAVAVGLGALGLAAGPAQASSHREAPLIADDPSADITDLYAFKSPDKTDSTTFVMNVNPFSLAAGGPNFHKFGDDVLYRINIDNNGDAVEDVAYEFRFTTKFTNPNTFLYNTNTIKSLDDPAWNIRQSYSVTEIREGKATVIGANLIVPPANVGPRSTPNYDALATASISNLPNGIKSFAGPRDDPFFADLGSIFDLGALRPFNEAHLAKLPKEPGRDYLAGFNVSSIVLQVPNASLIKGDPVIGTWASTWRRSTRVIGGPNGVLKSTGAWVQVARLGMPLVNEVVVPVGLKDKFNASVPRNDAQFAGAVLKPELGALIPVLYPGVKVPTEVNAGLSLGGREDVATIFLTGIKGVNQPANVKPAEMLRINTSTATGFPNGRLLTDDVVDTSLRVVAGATAFSKEFDIAPNNVLGDGVDANDKPFGATFPYLASPTSGYDSES